VTEGESEAGPGVESSREAVDVGDFIGKVDEVKKKPENPGVDPKNAVELNQIDNSTMHDSKMDLHGGTAGVVSMNISTVDPADTGHVAHWYANHGDGSPMVRERTPVTQVL
jgi:hypothetical protein